MTVGDEPMLRKKRLELLDEDLKGTFDFYMGEIQLKANHAMFEHYKSLGFIDSIESAMFANLVFTVIKGL